jgi:hypothetical protein
MDTHGPGVKPLAKSWCLLDSRASLPVLRGFLFADALPRDEGLKVRLLSAQFSPKQAHAVSVTRLLIRLG